MHALTHTHTHMHAHANTHTRLHTHTHTDVQTHTQSHTNIHTQTHTLLLQPPRNLAAQGSTTRAAGTNWHAATRRRAYLRPTPTECRWPCWLGKRATHHQVGSKGLLVHLLTWWHKSTHHGHCEDTGGDRGIFFSPGDWWQEDVATRQTLVRASASCTWKENGKRSQKKQQ